MKKTFVKNNILKFMSLLIILLFLVNLSSATHYNRDYINKDYNYYPEKYLLVEEKTVTKTFFVNDNYKNEKRYSTYDYRHGYSYRNSKDYSRNYFHKNYFIKNKNYPYYENEIYLNHRRENKDYSKDLYYEYNPFTKVYEKKVCYHDDPPKKLFYIKC